MHQWRLTDGPDEALTASLMVWGREELLPRDEQEASQLETSAKLVTATWIWT